MKIEFDDISRFVHGQMPADELAAFEKTMATDADLRASVEKEIKLYRDLQNAVRYNTLIAPKTAAFKSILQEISNKNVPRNLSSPVPPKTNTDWWKYATAAVLLVATLAYVFYPSPAPNTEALYAQYFAPDCTDVTMSATTPSDIEQAKELVCKKQWAQAKTVLNNLNTPEARLLLVQVFAATGDYAAALSVLDALDDTNSANAAWARAGVLLKQNKIADCKAILTKIVDAKAAHYKDAAALLNAL